MALQASSSGVPSHSSLMSSERYLTSPSSARFSHPIRLFGKAQVPSVTVLDLAKLAPEVALRFLSFSSLLAFDLSSISSTCGEFVNGEARSWIVG